MATTIVNPVVLVVFSVIHHRQDINYPSAIVDPANQPEAIVSDIENSAIADLVRRPECLPEFSEIGPFRAFGQLIPDA